MKSIYITALIGIMTVGNIACTKILQEDPPSAVSLSSFYLTAEDAQAGLFGAYSPIYNVLGFTAIQYGELNADDLDISPLVADQYSWDNFTYNSDVTGSLWSNCYVGINRSNEVIAYTPRVDMSPTLKADIIAEAKALRGFYYFQLVRAMGGVPIYETPTVGFDSIYIPRASAQQVYDLITRDLTAAAEELEPNSSPGRINAHIANSLLARVWLYTGNYAGALAAAKKVIDANAYQLYEDYADVFRPQNRNGIEHIWQLQYLSGEINNIIPGAFGPRQTPGPYAKSFWAKTTIPGSFAPSATFVAENPESYRKSVTITDHYEHIDGVTGTLTMQDIYGGIFPYYVCKFDDRQAELQSGENFNIIRYADILLIAAEALNEVDPDDTRKYDWINRVRERARNGVESDLPDLAGLSQDAFRDAVLEERRFELAFEGQRAWDLKRRGLFLEKLRAQGKTVADYMLLFPIPDIQRKLNTSLDQNLEW